MWQQIVNLIQSAFSNIVLSSQDVFNTLFSLILSIIIGIIISQVYKLTHQGVNFELSFMTSLVILAPIVTVVMFFIQGNLILSLGLVGSLSIIRFRTPIKDTRDMVYLFWVIAVGLGAGTYNWGLVALASMAILVTIIVLYYVKYGRSQKSDYVLVIAGEGDYDHEKIMDIVQKNNFEMKLRSQNINRESWEVIFELHVGKIDQSLNDLIKSLKDVNNIESVSLLAPQLTLPA
jgi:chromate transport protein ChrA